jgi:hypothetical protein
VASNRTSILYKMDTLWSVHDVILQYSLDIFYRFHCYFIDVSIVSNLQKRMELMIQISRWIAKARSTQYLGYFALKIEILVAASQIIHLEI